ncbi:hypothetical protein EKO27_g11553 [Xylaria grammica]|uniref:Peptidyl-tRNA hydrolase n=1 Tax=Xylaria grammica TaxID=363999 RepID=A0A439CN12_9PEZI|nr:hypothetical protein EKO27_g11553 [Xylaria grammica]
MLAAADSPDYQAQFQEYLGPAQVYFEKIASAIPSPNKYDPVAAAEAKAGSNKIDIIGLHNWKETLYEPVTPGATTPEEWWVLVTGGNKTCFGHCGKVEAAFNETAGKFATEPDSPHMALLNCENQPVLCNAWSAPVGSLWIIDMLPEPSPINIFTRRLNLTTTTSDDLLQLQKDGVKTGAKEHDGVFHPFNGPLAQNGLSIPAGYVLWAFGLLPSWAFMILVSLFSRRMMAGRMEGQMHGGPRPAPTGQAAPRR